MSPRVTGKPEAVAAAARRVFGREGYPRASIGAIADEAGVSTRTIYNHFSGKDELFQAVLSESAEAVADNHLRNIAAHLDGAADPIAGLRALAHDWVAPLTEFAEHFAMVRQIMAEAAHVPIEVLQAWFDAGPDRAVQALAVRLERFAADGHLAVDDPHRAAVQFTLLAGGEVNSRSYFGARPLPADEVRDCVDAGVAAFLRAYAPLR